jgi:hypothetical protein
MDRPLARSTGMTVRLAIALLALLLVAGCGEDDPATTSTKLSEAIKYEVIGGDGFRDDKLTVQADGSAQLQTRAGTHAVKLTAVELSALAHEVERAGLPQVQSATTDPPQPDAVSYRLTYRGRQVETDTGALPDRLRALIGTFDALIDRYGAA